LRRRLLAPAGDAFIAHRSPPVQVAGMPAAWQAAGAAQLSASGADILLI